MPLDLLKVKKVRTDLGLTMREAAERAGLGSAQAWNKYESGDREPSVSAAERLAAALGVKLQKLLTD